MDTELPQIIGITGGSCAGKTWLADRLQSALSPNAARLALDDFYRDRSHLPLGRRAKINFDHPNAIDWERFEEVLSDFSSGRVTSVPRYDYVSHGRSPEESYLEPAPILIVEGLWLFRRPSLRSLFTLKIFLRSTKELCIERRVTRDTAERGRTVEQVRDQLQRYTIPMFEKFVAPQEKWADVVLNAPIGAEDVAELLNRIDANEQASSVGI